MTVKKYRLYTDGSYNKNKPDEVHGGIVYWDVENNKVESCAHVYSKDPRLCSGWNVGGEVLAAYVGVKAIIAELLREGHCADSDPVIIELVYDYEGVGNWITGVWKNRNKASSIWYYNAMKPLLDSIRNVEVRFIWVKGHGAVVGNNIADEVAEYSMANCHKHNAEIFCFDDKDGKLAI